MVLTVFWPNVNDNDPALSANDLNQDFSITQQWTYQWKMEFNRK